MDHDDRSEAENMSSFTSIAPTRLCLFGEHQDYLSKPVIALSLPLHCRIKVTLCESRIITLNVPSLDKTIVYNLEKLPPKQDVNTKNPDFALAAIHEALKDGWTFEKGATCVSTVDLPMQAGCSTSSAFCVAWIQMLAKLSGQPPLKPLELAKRAHCAEVTHFGAPGGTMDHVTSAVGGLLRIGPGMWQVESLPLYPSSIIGVWVLAYSGEPKDTLRHLHRCKNARLELLDKLGGDWDNEKTDKLTEDELELLKATRINRDMEVQAAEAWEGSEDSNLGERLGALMLRHHEVLRDGLHLSTAQLEKMNTAAMGAGAWGFKVVGSGGGGCAVAWTSKERAEAVAEAMKYAGAPSTWIIREPSKGAYIQKS